MRIGAIIFSALLLIFTLARLADSCSKREKRKKGLEFRVWVNKINHKKDSVMAYRFFAEDSITWMANQRKSLDRTLDSSIQYYKDNYAQDEERYKIYLKILYEYKKISYLYYDWIKSSRIRANTEKKEKDYRLLDINELQRREREIMFGMSRYNIELITID